MNTVHIYPCDYAESPREWTNLGTVWAPRCYGLHERAPAILGFADLGREEAEAALGKEFIYLPVYKYEHGGVAYNTTGFHCRRDSGQVGWIFVHVDVVRKEYGRKRISAKLRQRVLAVLAAETEAFSQWANGDVYGFTIEDENGDPVTSCVGFYGRDVETNGMLEYIPEELHDAARAAEVEY